MPTLDEIREHFRQNVKSRRRELSLSQEQLAAVTGIPQPSIANFERGTRVPSFETLVKLAEGLRTSPDVLLRPHVFSEISG